MAVGFVIPPATTASVNPAGTVAGSDQLATHPGCSHHPAGYRSRDRQATDTMVPPDLGYSRVMAPRITKSEADWRSELTPEQYHVLREKGTERAFTGALWDEHRPGTYRCAGCGAELFDSDTKFESGTGWPSFYQPMNAEAVDTETDRSFFMTRTEVNCATCGGHLGHVFNDGPRPTGLRYCINSASLTLDPSEQRETMEQV
jgi:peptide-methionine (R)-S-oxide reductase